jgi:hypothetical protein
MNVLGHPTTDLINLPNGIFITTENRHPAAPEENNNYQGYVCVCSQILFRHTTMATFLHFPISSPQFTCQEHTKYLTRYLYKQSLYGSEVCLIEEKSQNILLQLQKEVETTVRKIIL